MFLWVRLVVDMVVDGIMDGNTTKELLHTLRTVPKELGGTDGFYMRMIRTHVKESYLLEAAKLFQLVLPDKRGNPRTMDIITLFFAAEGHMETESGQELIAINEKINPQSWDGSELRRKGLSRRLKSRCGGLLEGEEEIQFMHQTAKEFMSQKEVWDHIFPHSSGFSDGVAKDLAVLSGLVRRVKCGNRETLKTQGICLTSSWQLSRDTSRVGKILNDAFWVALRLDTLKHQTEEFRIYTQLMDELDAVGQKLTSDSGNGIAVPHGKWIPILTNVVRGYSISAMSLSEFMTTIGCVQYVWIKIRTQHLLPLQLKNLLLAASRSFSAYDQWPRVTDTHAVHLGIVRWLFGKGADPNWKVTSDNPSRRPDIIDGLNKAKSKDMTVWVFLLQRLYHEVPNPQCRDVQWKMWLRS